MSDMSPEEVFPWQVRNEVRKAMEDMKPGDITRLVIITEHFELRGDIVRYNRDPG
jgi:hypothetical protein